jgi:transketolase
MVDLAQQSVTTIRTLSIDAVQAANSGHPGMPMGCAPMAYVLFREAMRHDPADPSWWARDRFVLSAGHGSMLLYSALHLAGYEHPTLDEIRDFRQWGSPTAGHPEVEQLAGVEMTTGPLGQGFATGVGMALAAERLSAEYDLEGVGLFPQRIYAIVSDGDLMEGVASEAASFAGHQQLGRLVYLYDDNRITIDGGTDVAFSEDVAARFVAYGWHVQHVADGNDLDALRAAVAAAEQDPRPSIVAVRTVIGYGSPHKAGTSSAHGSPLGADEVALTKEALGWTHPEPFTVPVEVAEHMDAGVAGADVRGAWQRVHATWSQAHPDRAEELARRMAGDLPEGWLDALPAAKDGAATRANSGEVINALAPVLPELFGGAADLAGSNKTDVDDGGVFSPDDRLGRNLRFGVREHAMGAIANGMTLHGGFRPYVGTFLIFTDYARGAIRLGALMEQPVVWVATHDSIGLGEDGPTHQPIAQLAGLRAMPNVTVLRPADADEVVGAWAAALQQHGPSVVALSRQGVPALGDKPGGRVQAVARGGYVLRDLRPSGSAADALPDVILLGTGSEVQFAVAAAESLVTDGIAVRVVSLPSWELFLQQDAAYRSSVLPPSVRARVSIEAATTFGWERFVGSDGIALGIDHFGASAPAERLYEEFGMTSAAVEAAARRLLGR